MIYTGTAGILSQNGYALTQKVNSLTFSIQGIVFPKHYASGDLGGSLVFGLSQPTTATVNYGDGTVENLVSYPSGSVHIIEFSEDHYHHDYQYVFKSKIVIEFANLKLLKYIRVNNAELVGEFPAEVEYAINFEELVLVRTQKLNSIPLGIFKSGKMKNFQTSSATLNKLNKLPDSIFENTLEQLQSNGGFDLSDILVSNFFKINQLKDTLYFLDLRNCEIEEFPAELAECTELTDLKASDNPITHFPQSIANLPKLTVLYIGDKADVEVTSWPYLNLPKLEQFLIYISNMNLFEVPYKWVGLKSLSSISVFQFFITTSPRFDEFIEHFYTLCTSNAYLDVASVPSGEEYPEQFRNISWGHSSLSFTGLKQAPIGYQQGISNGNPQTNGEKVYVLQNQLGHTITHA